MRTSKKARASAIATILHEYFPKPPVPLAHDDAYTLLLAVLLSAQCTDERVNKVTPALFALANTPELMMKQEVAKVQEVIRSCGLAPRKAKAIVALSQILVERHHGKVPQTIEALEELPGVGRKTASVVLVQAFNIPAFPVDTHIHRLAYRWALSTGDSVVQTEKDLRKVFPMEIWGRVHLQMIYFGRKYCPARGHVVAECPICSKFARRGV